MTLSVRGIWQSDANGLDILLPFASLCAALRTNQIGAPDPEDFNSRHFSLERLKLQVWPVKKLKLWLWWPQPLLSSMAVLKRGPLALLNASNVHAI